ncbi:hypothetical protein OQA88_266 [Cercophora sp. LCS_1]
MSDEVYRRVGRGGAGNWYSKKDVEAAEKAQAEADLEAQKAAVAPVVDAASASAYARSGRGGAGNFKDKAEAVASIQAEREEIEKAKATVAAAVKSSVPTHVGRGGAGNWTTETAAQADEDKQKVEDLELKVLKDVEAALEAPKATYQQS